MGSLLSMMNGGMYFDSCLQANVDFTYVGFVATANDLEPIPDAVLDRFFVIHLPVPTSEHFETIMAGIKRSEAAKFGCEVADLPQLEGWQMDDLRDMLDDRGISIRGVQRAYRILLGDKAFKDKCPDLNFDLMKPTKKEPMM